MIDENHVKRIADELGIQVNQVRAAAELLEDGCTVPFIARYRKEATGSLDEVQTAAIRDRLEQLAVLEKRREAIMKSLEERELLTEDLRQAIMDGGFHGGAGRHLSAVSAKAQDKSHDSPGTWARRACQ